MIKLRTPIEDIENTIISPVIVSVMNELKKILFVDKDTHIKIMNKETEYIAKNWKAGDTKNNSIEGPRDEEVEIEYEISYDDQYLKTTKYRDNRSRHILLDPVTFTNVKSLYLETIVKLNFKIKNKSKINLTNTLNTLRLRFIKNREVNCHDIEYYYILPEFVPVLINNIRFNKDYALGTETSFDEYLSTMVSKGFTFIGNQSGDLKSTSLTFKEVQKGVIGMFKNDMLNSEKVFDKETNMWESSFEYELRFDQPMFYDIEYPTIAYQYKLEETFINLYKLTGDCSIDVNGDYYQGLIKKFNINREAVNIMSRLGNRNTYVRIPESDIHIDIYPQALVTRIFSVQVTINKEDKKSLFNLNDLGDIQVVEDVLDVIRDCEYQYMTDIFESIFYVEIYENDKRMDGDALNIDQYLNVVANEDLDMSKSYRVFFNVIEDLGTLSVTAKKRIAKCGDKLYKLLEAHKKIVEIKEGNGTDRTSNLDVNIHLMKNPGQFTFFYSMIIACIMKPKGDV